MHYKSSSNLTKLYTVVINCSAGHCFNILDNTSTPSSLEKHFSQSQPKSFHRLLSLDADSEQLGPTQPPGRRAPPPWQLAMPALDSSLPATISTIAASHPQHHLPPYCPSPAQLTLSSVMPWCSTACHIANPTEKSLPMPSMLAGHGINSLYYPLIESECL